MKDSQHSPARDDAAPTDERDFAEVTAVLGRLKRRVDDRRYPGAAWPVVQRPRRGWVLPLAVSAAAAAVVLIAAMASRWLVPPTKTPTPAGEQVAAVRPTTAPADANAAVPVRLDPAVAGRVTWRMPRVSLPPVGDANAPTSTWRMPHVTFPSLSSWPGGSRRSRPAPNPAASRPTST